MTLELPKSCSFCLSSAIPGFNTDCWLESEGHTVCPSCQMRIAALNKTPARRMKILEEKVEDLIELLCESLGIIRDLSATAFPLTPLQKRVVEYGEKCVNLTKK